MPIVSDSSPLIALSAIDRLSLLPTLFDSVLIPPAVAREVGTSILKMSPWLHEQSLVAPLQTFVLSNRLGDGERQAIALSLECRADLIVLDDLPARRLAWSAGLQVIGTVGILLAAKRRGLINLIRPELDNLLRKSFFLGRELYKDLLRAAGEPDL